MTGRRVSPVERERCLSVGGALANMVTCGVLAWDLPTEGDRIPIFPLNRSYCR
jgi:hypothetical protein